MGTGILVSVAQFGDAVVSDPGLHALFAAYAETYVTGLNESDKDDLEDGGSQLGHPGSGQGRR